MTMTRKLMWLKSPEIYVATLQRDTTFADWKLTPLYLEVIKMGAILNEKKLLADES